VYILGVEWVKLEVKPENGKKRERMEERKEVKEYESKRKWEKEDEKEEETWKILNNVKALKVIL